MSASNTSADERERAVPSRRPLRVLAADDSAVMRGIMWRLFETYAGKGGGEMPPMELCGVAQDGVECLESVRRLDPDVLVLDLEMPRMNGLDVLDALRSERPSLPVIMCSAYTDYGARSTLEALARGASDYVTKPAQQRDLAMAIESLAHQLLPRIAALAKGSDDDGAAEAVADVSANGAGLSASAGPNGPAGSATQPMLAGTWARVGGGAPRAMRGETRVEVLVIGLSTGGPAALEHLLPRLPASFPVPILIVQHMPKLFTRALAERLDRSCALRVEEAYADAVLRPGTVWLAPGDAHMEVAPRRMMPGDDRSRGVLGARVALHRQRPLNHCMPAVDYLFFSAARLYGAGALGLVMTGMGADGLDGARAIYDAGGTVLAQDEASSAVWGMPGRISDAGIASAMLSLSAIAPALMERVGTGTAGMDMKSDKAVGTMRREVSYGLY